MYERSVAHIQKYVQNNKEMKFEGFSSNWFSYFLKDEISFVASLNLIFISEKLNLAAFFLIKKKN